QKIVAEPKTGSPLVVPSCGTNGVLFSDPKLFDDEAHAAAGAPVQWCLPRVRAIRDEPEPARDDGESRLFVLRSGPHRSQCRRAIRDGVPRTKWPGAAAPRERGPEWQTPTVARSYKKSLRQPEVLRNRKLSSVRK